jgi:hypothetical protein
VETPILFLCIFFETADVSDTGDCFPPEHDMPSPVAAVTSAAFWMNERRDEFIGIFLLKL